MRSNLTSQDRSFSGFSYPQQVGTTPPSGRPLAPQTTGSNNPFLANNQPLRRSSTISTASDYEPGVDLSSYDVSTTRAMPGYRGAGSANGALGVPVPGSNQAGWGWLNQGAVVAGSAPVGGNYLGGVLPPPLPIEPAQQPEKQPQKQPQDKTPQVPQVDGNTSSLPESTPALPARDPSPEAYQIKHITWVDPTTLQTRRLPILLQNENGPCPLLALVNALTLSTPSSATTALTEILRVREHISLGLLLDAVFDGVVTQTSTQGVDIDMSDLFAFLMSLSTGMNVNPRFVFPQLPSGDDGPPQLLGSFDQTREMRLYNSFGVPLYHGWLPSPTAAVYKVMQRVAPTYEEVQNLLLQEEIILHRISTALGGSPEAEITRQEERVVEDAGVIRGWLDDSCTQLTDWGLEKMVRCF
ncbi:hypothetical protein L211DRAFT_702726 [Terfezia boudieri ATCC MYA-4762]|uniref:MINDY deubiquitinase domain-containing protein n=1 Tax=Terfezia boudieri ATCC MYA-4762 TaxID=1051890 RepID=A0A3N4LTJ2_9PEZI|nr:hypothetical protein L211DRAFT_702726 [Terfezia boudieri ATCC MYA-4762]